MTTNRWEKPDIGAIMSNGKPICAGLMPYRSMIPRRRWQYGRDYEPPISGDSLCSSTNGDGGGGEFI